MRPDESTIQLVPVPDFRSPAVAPTPVTAPTQAAVNDAGNPLPPLIASSDSRAPMLPAQFAILLPEVLAGVRPAQQLSPWLTTRSTVHLRRLMPMFKIGHQPRVLRILTAKPSPDVVEMTVVAAFGPRPRALAIRLEQGPQAGRWQCTDIESA